MSQTKPNNQQFFKNYFQQSKSLFFRTTKTHLKNLPFWNSNTWLKKAKFWKINLKVKKYSQKILRISGAKSRFMKKLLIHSIYDWFIWDWKLNPLYSYENISFSLQWFPATQNIFCRDTVCLSLCNCKIH